MAAQMANHLLSLSVPPGASDHHASRVPALLQDAIHHNMRKNGGLSELPEQNQLHTTVTDGRDQHGADAARLGARNE